MIPRLLLALGGLLTVVGVDLTVWRYETLLASGTELYLELGGVDPRSLVAGDYMRLAPDWDAPPPPDDAGTGVLILRLDERRVARFARFDEGQPLGPDELRVRYHVEAGEVRLVPASWFIEEGTDTQYLGLSFARVHVAEDGTALLVDLLDAELHHLGPYHRRW
jgi:uncharacterized membrane-anchored protein